MRKAILSFSSILFITVLIGCAGDTGISPSCPNPEFVLGSWNAIFMSGRSSVIDRADFSVQYFDRPETRPSVEVYRSTPEYSMSFDTSYAGVKEYFEALTDGNDNNLAARLGFHDGASRVGELESTGLRGGVTGDLFPDLSGTTPTKVMYHFNAIVFDSPGEDPNNDGIWTDITFSVTIEFWGYLRE